jgi:hypothetical protein
MLGRRVAVAASSVVLAVSGGTALAATHGTSHSSKPQVHKVVRPHKAAPAVVRSEHHCHDSGGAIASQL